MFLVVLKKRKFIENFGLQGHASQYEITAEELVYYAGTVTLENIHNLTPEYIISEVLNGRKMEKRRRLSQQAIEIYDSQYSQTDLYNYINL
jgi:hypothetical protein